MRQALPQRRTQHTQATRPSGAAKLSGLDLERMLRSGQIAGQALGLLQLVAASQQQTPAGQPSPSPCRTMPEAN
jgi:hypothetical protein